MLLSTSSRAAHMVEMLGVSKSFQSKSGKFEAVADISFSVAGGQLVSIVGPSGCGKSTLLQIAAGLTSPTTGTVTVDGQEISKPSPDKVGVCFQEPLLLPWKTTAQNVEYPLALMGVPQSERSARSEKLLDLIQLREFAHFYPHQLSGGMRQRVAIARALVREPQLLLMDEPFGALDEQTRTRMWQQLLSIHARTQAAVLFITHSLVEAIYLADEVLVMAAKPGRIVERIKIDLPRPRTPDMLGSEQLGALRNRLWSLIAGPDEQENG